MNDTHSIRRYYTFLHTLASDRERAEARKSVDWTGAHDEPGYTERLPWLVRMGDIVSTEEQARWDALMVELKRVISRYGDRQKIIRLSHKTCMNGVPVPK